MRIIRHLGLLFVIISLFLSAPTVQAAGNLSEPTVQAAEDDSAEDTFTQRTFGTKASGKCGAQGSSLNWVLDNVGTLTVSGFGSMEDYGDETPWSKYDSKIEKVVIKDGVKYIGSRAFQYCQGLKEAEIAGTVAVIGEEAFSHCVILKTVMLSSGTEVIGNGAFVDCHSLAEITLPDTLTTIGDEAFGFCKRLIAISIPENVTVLGSRVFRNCRSLKEITVSSGNPKYDSRDNCNAIINSETDTLVVGGKTTVIPKSVTVIDEWSFATSDVAEVEIPDSVTRIGANAFCMCEKLLSVHIPKSTEYIGSGAFSCCGLLQDISVDEENPVYDSRNHCCAIIETHRKKLIAGCVNTKIPYTTAVIGPNAFNGCGLKSLLIPSGVTKIGRYAFDNNWDLADIYFRGTEAQWREIDVEVESVGSSSCLKNAKIHYNYWGRGDGTTGSPR